MGYSNASDAIASPPEPPLVNPETILSFAERLLRSGRVIEVLSRLVSERGAPLFLRSDNGPEFVSRALLKWIVGQGIETALIDPGKPWQNGATESFNGKFRDECLSLEWFRSRAEAKVVIETWRRHFNEVRPHSSLGYLTPAAFVARLKEQDAAPATATGRTAAVLWSRHAEGVRWHDAPPRRITVPQGAIEGSNQGGRLKLKLLRRNRAGQGHVGVQSSSEHFNPGLSP